MLHSGPVAVETVSGLRLPGTLFGKGTTMSTAITASARSSIIRRYVTRIVVASIIAHAASAVAIPSNLKVQLDNPGPLPNALNSQFGAAIAATGKIVFVGAPAYDQAFADSGAVFAFSQKTGAPIGGPLFSSVANAGDFVGSSLAANKKYWVTGAPGTTVAGAANAGSIIIVFIHPGDGVPINNPLPGIGDNFGASVALYKDLLAIGAPKDTLTGGPTGSGVAFLMDLKTPSPPVQLSDPGAATGDTAGKSVAIGKDYVVVGCPGRQVGIYPGAGVAVVFSTTTHAYLMTLTPIAPETDGGFGTSVAVSGTLVSVGSPNVDDPNGGFPVHDAGAVYQYDARTGAQLRQLPAQPEIDAHFGSTLATDGKLLVVGSPDYDGAVADIGKTSTYKYKTGEFIRPNLSENPTLGGNYGRSATVLKGGRYAVGEPFAKDASANIVGAAYIYNKWP
jgi:hypothetical protein